MEPSAFEDLLRRVAHPRTRRVALAALLGAALHLSVPTMSEATKKAQRRKDRKRRQARGIKLKPISILVDNSGGDKPVLVEHGVHFRTRNRCCWQYTTASVPQGQTRFFNASETDAYVWIDNKFWFDFSNDFLLEPAVSAALNGMAKDEVCCKPEGQTVVSFRGMSVGELLVIPMAGQNFRVVRNRDTNYKAFTLFMPAVQ